MRTPRIVRHQRVGRGFSASLAAICLHGLMLAGCSSMGQDTPAVQAQAEREPIAGLGVQNVRPESNPAALFVAEAQHKTIAILDSGGNKIGAVHIPSFIIAVDKEGDLYTEDGEYGATVTIYAPPYKTGRTIKVTRNEHVGAIAVDPNSDIWAVVLFANGGGTPHVVFYKHGQDTPCNTLPAGVEQTNAQAAFDADGTLFFDGANPNVVLVSISGGCQATGSVVYDPNLGYIYALGFDSQDNLVLQTSGPINIYAHPSNGQIGQPIGSLSLKPIDKKYTPSLLALTADGKHLWASVCCVKGINTIGLYAYPAGGAPLKTIGGLPEPVELDTFPSINP